MKMNLDKNTEYIISMLEENGFEAYAVGGCVRDMLMNREVNDFDITTSALPQETKAVFASIPVIETGIKHGTVTVILNHVPYEVTTFRTESSYTDSRHPDSVTFVRNVNEDLSRRDFTMNEIAYSPRKGIIDPFGGELDINNRIIRAVGNPEKRFSEDALRILRALRFSSVLGFDIENRTKEAIFKLADNIKMVSPERIFVELKKLVLGKNAQAVLNKYIQVISQIIPINGDYKSVSALPFDYRMRLSCLCGNSVIDALNYLRADNETKSICKLLVNSLPIPEELPQLKAYIADLGKENAIIVAEYRQILYGENKLEIVENLLSSKEPIFLHDLAINGNDLVNIGIKGASVGRILKTLLSEVHHNIIENKKEPLLIRAKVLI